MLFEGYNLLPINTKSLFCIFETGKKKISNKERPVFAKCACILYEK
jgi:hypothetical protein